MADLRVLLCDDDPDLCALLTRRLEKMGLEHDVAYDGRQAMSLIEKNEYDVIVADIYMPEATGLEVMQFAKQRDPDIQVVIITSSATLDNAIDALNHGAFGYLTKPFDHLIVFDNMVSRAVEYNHLLVANQHKAEAQKRRGDMLEDEVAERIAQLHKKQKGLLDLLGSLPDGILVVEEGGKVVLSSPVGERWLARDRKSGHQPIHAFIAQVNSQVAERNAKARVEDHDLQLLALDFPADGDLRRKAVIIREVEADGIGAGSLVTETVMGIKQGLATLYQQGVGTELVLNLANQFAVLEQLAGWAPARAELAAPPIPRNSPENIPSLEPRVSEPQPALAEPEGPRLNTAELAEALRAAAQAAASPTPTDVEPLKPADEARLIIDVERAAAQEIPIETAGEDTHILVQRRMDQVAQPTSVPAELAHTSAASDASEPSLLEATVASDVPVEPRSPDGSAATEQVEAAPAFPSTQPRAVGDVAKTLDSRLFRPRIIPEAMSAKLGELPAIQPGNGQRRPIQIQASAADTQIFRRVLEKMSGESATGLGDSDPNRSPTEISPSQPREGAPLIDRAARSASEPVLPAGISIDPEEPEPEETVEPVRLNERIAVPPVEKPKPRPKSAEPAAASWPPKLPSQDPEWDDSLDLNA